MDHSTPHSLKTPLYNIHKALNAKMVLFGGWEMPLSYRSIIDEHKAVRSSAAIFDVSHMGRIVIIGPQAASFVDYVGTNSVVNKKDGTAVYTVLCRDDGTAVDDVIVLKHHDTRCSLIANGSNRAKVVEHLVTIAKTWDVDVVPPHHGAGIIALQGPFSLLLAAHFIPVAASLRHMQVTEDEGVVIARTGYTGELGLEFFGSGDQIVELWHRFLDGSAATGIDIIPAGLGARDTLRLEMGYALYGHELTDTIAPTESVAAWTVKWDKIDFLGREKLIALENSSEKRRQYGVKMERGVPRSGYKVWQGGDNIGVVTSGTFSPSLNSGIAIIMVQRELSPASSVAIEIRHELLPSIVTPLPFYSHS